MKQSYWIIELATMTFIILKDDSTQDATACALILA